MADAADVQCQTEAITTYFLGKKWRCLALLSLQLSMERNRYNQQFSNFPKKVENDEGLLLN